VKRLAILVGRALERAGVALLRYAEYQAETDIEIRYSSGPDAEVLLGLDDFELPMSPLRALEVGASLAKAANRAQIERDRSRLPLQRRRLAGIVH
jgi:hypothetical protein